MTNISKDGMFSNNKHVEQEWLLFYVRHRYAGDLTALISDIRSGQDS